MCSQSLLCIRHVAHLGGPVPDTKKANNRLSQHAIARCWKRTDGWTCSPRLHVILIGSARHVPCFRIACGQTMFKYGIYSVLLGISDSAAAWFGRKATKSSHTRCSRYMRPRQPCRGSSRNSPAIILTIEQSFRVSTIFCKLMFASQASLS